MSGLFSGNISFTPVNLDAYFDRIGYSGPREAALTTLKEILRLQAAAIPFENIDVLLGLGISIDSSAVDAKLITARRGGYCFEQNSLLLRVLQTLGFNAEALIGRSRWGRPINELVPRTHMVVRVKLDGEYWLADMGFGACMLTAPIRLNVYDVQQTRHEPVRLVPVDDELLLERLLNDEWIPVYQLALNSQQPVDLAAANWLIANHPDSHFRHRLVVSRTQDDIRYVLVDGRLTIRRTGAPAEHLALNADEIEQCLINNFNLPVQPGWRPLFEKYSSLNKQGS